uniref:Phytanoyl-CoA hydroxylase-interacting protein-like C-terminal domain-containing protein n=1 Tax=Denticeps clupeoides TaxID=299321 RepID=A0AAY4EWZ1_9TELE
TTSCMTENLHRYDDGFVLLRQKSHFNGIAAYCKNASILPAPWVMVKSRGHILLCALCPVTFQHKEYFEHIRYVQGGQKLRSVKDNSGSYDSPISRKLAGIFFNCITEFNTGQPPQDSPYGCSCYMVAAQTRSLGELFCQESLPELTLAKNHFLTGVEMKDGCLEFQHAQDEILEVIYTDPVQLAWGTMGEIRRHQFMSLSTINANKDPSGKTCNICVDL